MVYKLHTCSVGTLPAVTMDFYVRLLHWSNGPAQPVEVGEVIAGQRLQIQDVRSLFRQFVYDDAYPCIWAVYFRPYSQPPELPV